MATAIIGWAIGLMLTYAIVESKLLMPLRIVIIMRLPADSMLEELIYCQFCVGFWMHGIASSLYELDWMAGPRGAAIGIAVMLLARAAFGRDLIHGSDVERSIAKRERERER